jgi:2-polyprenyl-3-methyl-5-hydroxy-6-metoxy-1,4-benzoquinol methylase
MLSPEMESLKNRLKGTWSAGDFGRIAKSYETGAAEFIARLALKPGQRVLDVACSTGNLAIPAAKAGAEVIGIDIAPNLVEQARQRAASERLAIKFEEGDAEQLPYEDGSFDAVISMFGAMFAPRPDVVAAELTRVTRSGGLIAMANWTPSSFVGQMFKTIGALVPPPALMPSSLLWGRGSEAARALRSTGFAAARAAALDRLSLRGTPARAGRGVLARVLRPDAARFRGVGRRCAEAGDAARKSR